MGYVYSATSFRNYCIFFRHNAINSYSSTSYFCRTLDKIRSMDILFSNILIIDDNPEFAKSLTLLIHEVVGSHLLSVDCVNNVLDGIRCIRKKQFQYVFINTDMPNRDGIMATHLINMANPEITIVASSFHKGLFYQFLVENAGESIIYVPKDEIDGNALIKIFGIKESKIIDQKLSGFIDSYTNEKAV